MLWRCAQVSPLTGGQKDTQPPKLITAVPANASVNFSSKTIELKFDEFVQVKDIANQLVITPQTKKTPLVEARGKKIIVKFDEDLMPNTTYRLYFGNAIADMHEANVLSNFEYVFSTGNRIDSLFIGGKIRNAYNLKPEKDITVGLYNKNAPDSMVHQQKPLYFTKTSDNGAYKLLYLPSSSFKIAAFADKNRNLMYDAGEELVGFSDSLVTTSADTVVDIKILKEENPKVFLKKAHSPFYGLAYIIYNKEQKNVVIPYYADQKDDIRGINDLNDTCVVYYKNIFDTLRILIKHPERQIIDTIRINVLTKDRFEKLKQDNKPVLMIELKPMEGNTLGYFATPALVFNNWIDDRDADSTKMILQYKSDSLIKTALQLTKSRHNTFTIDNKLLPGTNYDIILKKGAFKTVMGIENDSVKISFKTSEPSDYAILNLKLLLPRKENYIVQLLNDKEDVIAEQYVEMSLTSSAEKTLKFRNLLPGNYFAKVIEDKNQNKKWDTGSFLSKKQPELIFFNGQSIKLMADWDSETEWKVD